MNQKLKIEKYVKSITKNETYQNYLKDAANFGYSLAQSKIKDLEAALKAYEDIGMDNVIIDEFDDY